MKFTPVSDWTNTPNKYLDPSQPLRGEGESLENFQERLNIFEETKFLPLPALEIHFEDGTSCILEYKRGVQDNPTLHRHFGKKIKRYRWLTQN